MSKQVGEYSSCEGVVTSRPSHTFLCWLSAPQEGNDAAECAQFLQDPFDH